MSADYRPLAADYDRSAQRTMALRSKTIARLMLQRGDIVLDAGCGTGLSFPELQAAVGPGGRIIGVEPSTAMMALARERVAAAGWENIQLIETTAESARLPAMPDAVLFNYVHDVMQSGVALTNLLQQCRPGARIAAAGIKHPSRWLDPFRWYRRIKSRACHVRMDGLDWPWLLLAAHVPDLQTESTLWTTGYMAWGRLDWSGTE